MSRLDDELKNAFRRVPPPADFTARLLERIAQQPAPKPRWWQRLAMFIEPPRLRWVAIGVTASLLLAIGAIQFSNMRRVPTEDPNLVAQTGTTQKSAEKSAEQGGVTPDNGHPADQVLTPTNAPKLIKRTVSSSTNHRSAMTRNQRDELRAEGEAAKEKLMLALSIASSALSEAQKAVHYDDGLNP